MQLFISSHRVMHELFITYLLYLHIESTSQALSAPLLIGPSSDRQPSPASKPVRESCRTSSCSNRCSKAEEKQVLRQDALPFDHGWEFLSWLKSTLFIPSHDNTSLDINIKMGVALSLPVLGYFFMPSLASYSTSLNLLFFYMVRAQLKCTWGESNSRNRHGALLSSVSHPSKLKSFQLWVFACYSSWYRPCYSWDLIRSFQAYQ